MEALGNPGVGVGPVDRVLWGSAEFVDGGLEAGDLLAGVAGPDAEQVAKLAVEGEEGDVDAGFGVFGWGIFGRGVFGLGGFVQVSQAKDAGLDADECAVGAVVFDVDGDDGVERRGRGGAGGLEELVLENVVGECLVMHGAAVLEYVNSGLFEGHSGCGHCTSFTAFTDF